MQSLAHQMAPLNLSSYAEKLKLKLSKIFLAPKISDLASILRNFTLVYHKKQIPPKIEKDKVKEKKKELSKSAKTF